MKVLKSQQISVKYIEHNGEFYKRTDNESNIIWEIWDRITFKPLDFKLNIAFEQCYNENLL